MTNLDNPFRATFSQGARVQVTITSTVEDDDT
jgi:hypothetical protein